MSPRQGLVSSSSGPGTRTAFDFPSALAAPQSLVRSLPFSIPRPSRPRGPSPRCCPDSGLSLWMASEVRSRNKMKLPAPCLWGVQVITDRWHAPLFCQLGRSRGLCQVWGAGCGQPLMCQLDPRGTCVGAPVLLGMAAPAALSCPSPGGRGCLNPKHCPPLPGEDSPVALLFLPTHQNMFGSKVSCSLIIPQYKNRDGSCDSIKEPSFIEKLCDLTLYVCL